MRPARKARPRQRPPLPLAYHHHDLLNAPGRFHRPHDHRGATDTEVFRAYVRRVLCPTLRKGDLVIMNKLSPHKSEPTLSLIAQAGAEVLFLPAYSPEFNPIESKPPCVAPKRAPSPL